VDKKSCLDSSGLCQNLLTSQTTSTTTKAKNVITSTHDSRNGVSGWTDWSTWSSCCDDNQVRRRTRVCIGTCLGTTSETESCDSYCQYTQWTPCSVTCNSNVNNLYAIGSQTRFRNCSNEVCNSVLKMGCYAFSVCPSNFQWSAWSAWSSCNSTCGPNGWQNRTRNCLNAFNYVPTMNEFCNGESFQQNKCNNISCGWSTWGDWSACSVSCNSGSQTRKRNCTDGQNCIGSNTETQACTGVACNTGNRKKKNILVKSDFFFCF
jgi:hypothetical protein